MKHLLSFILLLLSYYTQVQSAELFLEAESFEKKGGWSIDQQFMDLMGSSYLIAHGLGTPVDDMVANLIVAQLLLLDSENPEKDIMLYINSPGGSVTAGLAIYDTMQHIRADVQTICLGQAASMGAFLLCSGAKGKRMALPHSRVLIHQPLGGAQGQATDIEIQAQEILRIKKTLNEIMASNTGQSIKKIEKDTDRDYIMTPQEALEYGMIDKVITKEG